MTVTSDASSGAAVQKRDDLVAVTIDGFELRVPKGTLVIRAAELIGIQVPRFCDHPLLDPVGACRQCLVEVAGQPKPLASCTTTVSDGMVVKTQLTSSVADKAQQGIMELLLINHPLDCPVCDKGGECPLQNQAMSNGRGESRFEGVKRTYPKPINISSQVLLDRERCVLCARCTRFSAQVAGDPFIEMLERGALQQVGIYEAEPFQSYFSGNTVQICPVGALTGAAYRFRSRPFDLVSSPGVCEHCASGCAIRTDHRRGKVLRRLAGDDPEVNEEWNCDKGRWAFQYATAQDRLTTPLVREDGVLVPTSWAEALDIAANGLAAAKGATGVLVGGRATVEDAYAYAKLARVALGTNDVDFRARPHSAEEASFLAAHVAGRGLGVTYADLEKASSVLLVGLEPEDESPILFLRLRKAVRKGLAVSAVAAFASRGLEKLSGRLIAAAPGAEAEVLDDLRTRGRRRRRLGRAGRRGPRCRPRCVERRGPAGRGHRRAGRLGPAPRRRTRCARGRCPAGTAARWPPADGPGRPGRRRHRVGSRHPRRDRRSRHERHPGRRPHRGGPGPAGRRRRPARPARPDRRARGDRCRTVRRQPRAARVRGHRAGRCRAAGRTGRREGGHVPRLGGPGPAVRRGPAGHAGDARRPGAARARGGDGRRPRAARRRRRAGRARRDRSLGRRPGDLLAVPAGPPARPGVGEAVLATWSQLLDAGRLQDDEPFLAGTARSAVGRVSAATAESLGVVDGGPITVTTDRGAVTVPLLVTEMPDGVVWLPTNAVGVPVRRALAGVPGSVVRLSAGSADVEPGGAR